MIKLFPINHNKKSNLNTSSWTAVCMATTLWMMKRSSKSKAPICHTYHWNIALSYKKLQIFSSSVTYSEHPPLWSEPQFMLPYSSLCKSEDHKRHLEEMETIKHISQIFLWLKFHVKPQTFHLAQENRTYKSLDLYNCSFNFRVRRIIPLICLTMSNVPVEVS